jgi:hypothetical protein
MSRRVMAFGLLAAMAGAVALYDGALSPRLQSPGASAVQKPSAGSGDRSLTVDASLRVKVTPATDRTAVLREPLPPPGSPFMQIYDGLKARVAQGDHRAACRIGFELDRCANIAQIRRMTGFWRDALVDARLTPEKRRTFEKNAEFAERTGDEVEKVCAGVPETALPSRWDYFLAAALAGNDYAMWRVADQPPGLDSIHHEQTLEGWIQWRQYVRGLVDEGVRRGDPRMIAIASHDWFPREGFRARPYDPVKTIGYKMALFASASEGYRAAMKADLDLSLSRAQLSEVQLAQAQQFASAVTVRVPPGGVDWSRGRDPERNARLCEGL